MSNKNQIVGEAVRQAFGSDMRDGEVCELRARFVRSGKIIFMDGLYFGPIVTNDFCAMDAHARVPPTGLRLRWLAENSFAQWSASGHHNIKSFKRGYVAGFEAGHIACAAKYVQMPTADELAGVVWPAAPEPVPSAEQIKAIKADAKASHDDPKGTISKRLGELEGISTHLIYHAWVASRRDLGPSCTCPVRPCPVHP